MNLDLGHDKIKGWTDETWAAIDKAVLDEHKLTAVAARFLTPPVMDTSETGTVRSDTVLTDQDGLLSISESDTVSVIEISVQFKVRGSQLSDESTWKTTESMANTAGNLLAKGEDLIIFQGLTALNDPLFKSKTVIMNSPSDPQSQSTRIDSLLFDGNTQIIGIDPREPNNNPVLSIYGENTYAGVASGYALLQENHYGRQALILPPTIYADTYATRTTTLDIPAITAERLNGLLGKGQVYETSTLPAFSANGGLSGNGAAAAKGVLLALDGNTMDLVVQRGPTVQVIRQDGADFIFRVSERFAFRLKDTRAVVELDFSPTKK